MRKAKQRIRFKTSLLLQPAPDERGTSASLAGQTTTSILRRSGRPELMDRWGTR
jgi:hypothetical protein